MRIDQRMVAEAGDTIMTAKIRSTILLVLCAIFLDGLGVLYVVFMARNNPAMIERLIGISVSVMLFFISALFWYIAALVLTKKNTNFFLYNWKAKSSIDIKELTITKVVQDLDRYFDLYVNELKTDALSYILFTKNMPFSFRVLFPAWFLIICCIEDREELWRTLGHLDKSFLDEFQNLLFAMGAVDVSKHIPYLRFSVHGDAAAIKDYFMSSREYLSQSLLLYVKTHIDDYWS